MNKFASLFAVTLLLASSPASAEDDRSIDLRYCLDLPTDLLIAQCSGEIAAGEKGLTLSREAVDQILSSKKANAPAATDKPSDLPASGIPDASLPPEKTGDKIK